jgi:biotin carboxyl carrier protein
MLNPGDILALIEVMKTFQEVVSPLLARTFSCYLVEEGTVVEEGQPIIECLRGEFEGGTSDGKRDD